jgi:hypothetical protein
MPSERVPHGRVRRVVTLLSRTAPVAVNGEPAKTTTPRATSLMPAQSRIRAEGSTPRSGDIPAPWRRQAILPPEHTTGRRITAGG